MYTGRSAVTRSVSTGSSCSSDCWIETNGSIATRSEAGVPKSTIPFDPNPGTMMGERRAAPSAVKASRLAPRPAVAATPRRPEVHTGPHPWTRASPSANTTRIAAARNATPYRGFTNSSSTVSANATSATGGTRPSSGLPARNASAWAENTAAHRETTAARRSGPIGSAGAGWILACSPTSAAASRAARRVSAVGRPYQVVSGEDDETDRQREADPARHGGQEQAPPLERDREGGRRERDADQSQRRGRTQEHPSERERRRDRQEEGGGERDQTMRASGRSSGVCHRSSNLIEGGRTITSHPARARDRRAWLARPSSCACRSGGRRTGSVA